MQQIHKILIGVLGFLVLAGGSIFAFANKGVNKTTEVKKSSENNSVVKSSSSTLTSSTISSSQSDRSQTVKSESQTQSKTMSMEKGNAMEDDGRSELEKKGITKSIGGTKNNGTKEKGI